MKNLKPITFLFLMLGCSLFCKGQDTLIFKNGEKVAVEIISIRKHRILYMTPSNGDRISIFKSELSAIKYANGSQLIFTNANISQNIETNRNGSLFVNVGVGYSPEFNGQLAYGGALYPVKSNGSDNWKCYNITPNYGGCFEYGLNNRSSFGLAASYQSESLNWDGSPYIDRIARINIAFRFVFNLNKKNNLVDHYIGILAGCSYWTDNITEKLPNYPVPYNGPRIYFIEYPALLVGSFQVFYGVRFYFTNTFGIHFEVAIGSPYLAEIGITFRIGKPKATVK